MTFEKIGEAPVNNLPWMLIRLVTASCVCRIIVSWRNQFPRSSLRLCKMHTGESHRSEMRMYNVSLDWCLLIYFPSTFAARCLPCWRLSLPPVIILLFIYTKGSETSARRGFISWARPERLLVISVEMRHVWYAEIIKSPSSSLLPERRRSPQGLQYSRIIESIVSEGIPFAIG